MREFRVGDRVKVINSQHSGLLQEHQDMIGTLTKKENYTDYRAWRIKLFDMDWAIYESDIELVIEMNRNGANNE